ncbi:MAG: hypothetical protein ACI9KN_001358 [Gammaproteobacteria bacterium]|jgi:hypothetical protein
MFKPIGYLIVGMLLGVAVLKSYQHFNFQIPFPVATLADGAVYDGDLVDGIIEGKGRMVWPNGDRYEGNFLDGLFHGQGKYEWHEGASYQGEFKLGEKSGVGAMLYANKDTYTGEFGNGDFKGSGTYTTADNRIYRGDFLAGQFSGQGEYSDEVGNKHVGSFKDWVYQGQGENTNVYQDRTIGNFIDGELEGQGEFYGEDGSTYKGEFKQGIFSGAGLYTSAAGDIYEGQFEYGRYHGRGTLSYAKPLDGRIRVSGIWRNGSLVTADDPSLKADPEAINETLLYNQNTLLVKSWASLEANDPAKVELYFLGIAGDGSQAVFRREIQFVQNHFDRHLNTAGKSIALINAKQTIDDIPLATITSVRASLEKIADKMDVDNDILFIYLSSHGSKAFDFSLHQPAMALPDISAETLRQIIDESPIRWKVIVVSACYSGGFIPALQDAQSLIITAAAAEKTSFGCSNEAEFTYFGEAYFKDALSQTNDFERAFDIATKIVKTREKEQDYDHSNPQINKPGAILDQLEKWRNDSGL